MSIRCYRDLRVWQQGVDLVQEVYCMTAGFPREELYGLTNQMRRAAVSIPSNIAEGHEREHTREFIHCVSMAQGSLAEMETQAELAQRLGYITDEVLESLFDSSSALGRQLYRLRDSLNVRLASASGSQPPASGLRPPASDL